jgi:hypothetical protein
LKLRLMGGSGVETLSHLQDLEELQRTGAWTCEAADHDSPEGCSNLKCIKFKHRIPVIDEYLSLMDKCCTIARRPENTGACTLQMSVADRSTSGVLVPNPHRQLIQVWQFFRLLLIRLEPIGQAHLRKRHSHRWSKTLRPVLIENHNAFT